MESMNNEYSQMYMCQNGKIAYTHVQLFAAENVKLQNVASDFPW